VATKKKERETADGVELQSFRTLLSELGTQCRNTCELGEGASAIQATRVTDLTPLQEKAFALLRAYCSQNPANPDSV
jgi:hypothetical protein